MAFRQHDERASVRFLPPLGRSAPVHSRELQSWDMKPSNCLYPQPPSEHPRVWHELPETYNGFDMQYPIQTEYLYERSMPMTEYRHEHRAANSAFPVNGLNSNGLPEMDYYSTLSWKSMDAAAQRPTPAQYPAHELTRPKKRHRSNTSYMRTVPPDHLIFYDNHYLSMTIPQTTLSNSEIWGAQALCSLSTTPEARGHTELNGTPALTPPNSNLSRSSSLGPQTPPDAKSLRGMHLLSLGSTPELLHTGQLYDQINFEQRELFRDPRVVAQLDWFKRVESILPPTHYSCLAPIGIHILEAGASAQTGPAVKDADYLVGNCKQLEHWLVNGSGDKLFVMRDTEWFHTRPTTSASTVLEEVRTISGDDLQIEVQKLEKPLLDQPAVESMPIDEIMRRFADRSHTVAPINLLSLMCKDDGTVPWPLGKHCNLLNQAAAFSSSTAQTGYRASAGKQATEIMSRYIDLQSCIHFQIFGQAGAISSWHIDSIGPFTYVTLEPSVEGGAPKDVLKLWAYLRTDNLSPEEQTQIKREFIEKGGAFKPKPEHIRVISLVAGDTLIMPPGTIHSPITITDCLFRGGMVMQRKHMRKSVQEWRFCNDNGQCTNENQPRQARSVLDYFRRLVLADPESCGYDKDSIPEFEDSWRTISGSCMVCKCEGDCKKSKCGCIKNSQRCGSQCHRGKTSCTNPHGCEADHSKAEEMPKVEEMLKGVIGK